MAASCEEGLEKSASPEANRGHRGVVCDGCGWGVRGFHYKCLVCPDYDLCGDCEGKQFHPDHCMLRIASPRHETDLSMGNSQNALVQFMITVPSTNISIFFLDWTDIHYRATRVQEGHIHCNLCCSLVSNFCYTCEVCPDFHLCGTCEAMGLHPRHNMVRMVQHDIQLPEEGNEYNEYTVINHA